MTRFATPDPSAALQARRTGLIGDYPVATRKMRSPAQAGGQFQRRDARQRGLRRFASKLAPRLRGGTPTFLSGIYDDLIRGPFTQPGKNGSRIKSGMTKCREECVAHIRRKLRNFIRDSRFAAWGGRGHVWTLCHRNNVGQPVISPASLPRAAAPNRDAHPARQRRCRCRPAARSSHGRRRRFPVRGSPPLSLIHI